MPNGLIANLYGPVEGSKHDSSMLRESGLLDILSNLTTADGMPLALYGDKAYPIHQNLITPYRGAGLTAVQKEFNLKMNSARISVEWEFAKVGTLFGFMNYAPNLKVYLQPLLHFRVAVLLSNCHSYLYRSQTSKYFDVEPPILEDLSSAGPVNSRLASCLQRVEVFQC